MQLGGVARVVGRMGNARVGAGGEVKGGTSPRPMYASSRRNLLSSAARSLAGCKEEFPRALIPLVPVVNSAIHSSIAL